MIERIYTINLRREWLKAPKWKRAKKAVKALKEFVMRHLHVKVVKISNAVNNLIWKRGAKNPPHHITVKVRKEKDTAYVDLP